VSTFERDIIVYFSLKNYFNTSIHLAYYGIEASCTLSVSRIFGVTVALLSYH